MSIPLDRLYHYIESVAQDVYGDTIIYRFSPHGSKKIEDLDLLNLQLLTEQSHGSVLLKLFTLPEIYCYDQEPLNYSLYQNQKPLWFHELKENDTMKQLFDHDNSPDLFRNIRYRPGNVYDLCVLLHSERNSTQVALYQQNNFIPVYYWSHAIIARDWFRFAQHARFKKDLDTKTFLIYNRAWAGTREYRLKFADLLIEHNLVNSCQTSIGFVDNDLHYSDHQYTNAQWQPNNQLEDYFVPNLTSSCYSADFDINDYNSTDFEVVLETLFEDTRNHLTEKSLRPIACKQPFILAGTPGSLEYLKSYGFKTFSEVVDESYDTVQDHYQRMLAIIKVMETIKNWTAEERNINMQKISDIVEYNHKHFFSSSFFNSITKELAVNLKQGLDDLERTNTSEIYLNIRKRTSKNPNFYKEMFQQGPHRLTRQEHASVVAKARLYYNRHLASKKQ
jgi:hypothetical protein